MAGPPDEYPSGRVTGTREDLYRDPPRSFTGEAQGLRRGRMRRSPGNKEGAVMHRHTLTIITVLGLATGPSALFTANALGHPVSPDARDANSTAQFKFVDLRSPDTRDMARGVEPQSPQTVPPVELVVKSPSNDGFEWGDAGIGAGGALLIALLALGTGVGVQHRRHTHTPLAG
jgi:hypothetical protein